MTFSGKNFSNFPINNLSNFVQFKQYQGKSRPHALFCSKQDFQPLLLWI